MEQSVAQRSTAQALLRKSRIEVRNLCKRFPGVNALEDVAFNLRAGEVHCLVGENGAGKSTFVKILAGAQPPTSGEILIDGEPITIAGATHARQLGIACIFQELSVVDGLTVAENIALGSEPSTFGFVRTRSIEDAARRLLADIGFGHVSPSAKVMHLSTSEKQAVMICKALYGDAKIIIMDEPTSALEEREVANLFEIVEKLRSLGKSIIYITHKMKEIQVLADRATVFKDGRTVGTLDRAEINPDRLFEMMVGRKVSTLFPPKTRTPGEVALRVRGLTNGTIDKINLDIRQGEIVGIAGLVGSGRSETLRAIFGADPVQAGSVEVGGEKVQPGSIRSAIRAGIGLVPEERRSQGVVGQLGVDENILMVWRAFRERRVKPDDSRGVVGEIIRSINVKTPRPGQKISLLSGGNQQKAIIGRWLTMKTRVLLLDEPTRGVDVGAKLEIYRLIDELAREGLAILLVSSEMTEVIGLCDQIVVLNSGGVVAKLPGNASETEIVAASMHSYSAAGSLEKAE